MEAKYYRSFCSKCTTFGGEKETIIINDESNDINWGNMENRKNNNKGSLGDESTYLYAKQL